MIPLSLHEIAAAVDGRLVGADPHAVLLGPVVLDSRAARPGSLFVAVGGEHVDGHDFAPAAAAAGAVAVLASQPVDVAHVLVADTTVALGRLAADVRTRLKGVGVVAITGSQGKTGTKDLLAHLLAGTGPVVAPAGSLNNELGVPLTLLAADEATAHLVVEMGTRAEGDIRYLAGIARPSVGVALNVGMAHVGEFGSQAAIATAKGELVEALPDDGVAVLNADDPLVLGMAGRTRARVVTFGESRTADVRVEDLHVDDHGRPRFRLVAGDERATVTLQLLGGHQALNAAAAAGVALAAGIDLATVADALGSATTASRWRMERTVRSDGVVVVNDAYNASPDAMRSALRTLAVLGRGSGGARTYAVLGEMRELGEAARSEHHAVGRLAVRLGVDQVVVVGEQARALHQGACQQAAAVARDDASVLVPDVDAAVGFLAQRLRPGDVVLVKAARAAGLERVAAALLALEPERTGAR